MYSIYGPGIRIVQISCVISSLRNPAMLPEPSVAARWTGSSPSLAWRLLGDEIAGQWMFIPPMVMIGYGTSPISWDPIWSIEICLGDMIRYRWLMNQQSLGFHRLLVSLIVNQVGTIFQSKKHSIAHHPKQWYTTLLMVYPTINQRLDDWMLQNGIQRGSLQGTCWHLPCPATGLPMHKCNHSPPTSRHNLLDFDNSMVTR